MHPLRQIPARTAAVAAGLAATTALALVAAAPPPPVPPDYQTSSIKPSRVQRRSQGRGQSGACTSTRPPSRTEPPSMVTGDAGGASGAQTLRGEEQRHHGARDDRASSTGPLAT